MLGKTINDDHYQGLPLYKNPGYSYSEKRLGDVLATINEALEDSNFLTMKYIELTINRKLQSKLLTDNPVDTLIDHLRSEATSNFKNRRLVKGFSPKPIIDAIWQKEFNDNGEWLYKIAIILNYAAYQGQHEMLAYPDILENRIIFGLDHAINGFYRKHRSCLDMGIYPRYLNRGRHEDIRNQFPVIAKLCRVPTAENPNQSLSDFGTTRK